MADEEKRRRAGAVGVGESHTPDPNAPPKSEEQPELKPEDVHKVLVPELLKLDITRKVADPQTREIVEKRFVLVVPSEFTLGEIVLKDAGHDYDAYIRLVLIELQKVCPSPMLAFTSENLPYIDVVLIASNVRSFMERVLVKSAYVLDPDDAEEKKLALRPSDLVLNDGQTILIGASYVNRWVTKRTAELKAQKAALDAKNAAGAAQT